MLACSHCGQTFSTTDESRKHVCPSPGKISQASGARLMAAAMNWRTAAVAASNTVHGSSINQRYEAIATKAERAFAELVSKLTESET
jgi:hypothetical protein